MQEKKHPLRALFEKYREFIIYFIFGLATTLVSWVVYSLAVVALRGNTVVYHLSLTAVTDIERVIIDSDFELFLFLANAISWIIAVLFAFVTNKIWVFNSRSWRPSLVTREAGAFFGGRALTGILEIVTVPLLVSFGLNQTLFGVEGLPAKIIVSVAIVILNYVISKLFVFKKGKA